MKEKHISRNFWLCCCIVCAVSALTLIACGHGKKDNRVPKEDLKAKAMLQGVWVNEDEQYVAFKIKGDTIYYPDSTSMSVYFKVISDTLVIYGSNVTKYPIQKLTKNLFLFKNSNGDEVRLVNSGDHDDAALFTNKQVEALNQNKLIKRDTVVNHGDTRYHCYVQVNPTTYKVVKSSYNDEGVLVDNVYYDNIVNLNVYRGADKLFSGDFRKQQFSKIVPADFLSKSVFSDMVFDSIDSHGIKYIAILIIPDSQSSYHVAVTVNYNGKLSMQAN